MQRANAQVKRYSVEGSLAALLLWLFLQPLSVEHPSADAAAKLLLVIIIGFTPYLVTRQTYFLAGFVTSSALIAWSEFVSDRVELGQSLITVLNYMQLFILLWAVGSLYLHAASARTPFREALLSSVYVYLFIGILFAILYGTAYQLDNDSFIRPDERPITTDDIIQDEFIYFSYTTLTTLGYGDVLPVKPFVVRLTSIQSMIGVLYIAVFVGRLLGRETPAEENNTLV
jgi:hypothetical protein